MGEDQEDKYPNNVLLFRLAISNTFKHIAESVSNDEFSEVLTILKSKPKITHKLHKALVKELEDNMNADLEDILNDGSIQEGMNKIAKLSDANSSVTEDAWRPPGNVSLHLRSLDAQKIKEHSEELEKRVTKMEEENANLMEKIAARRSEMIALNENIEQSLNRSPLILDMLETRLENLRKSLTLLNRE
ncbi:polyamine-modulated factor 1 [Megachile rotundata]|uniref:polyamine-modulated factor 1 n=1 Tax=Megachile rotundata TaxID=143995 RepID=UPI000258D7EC|nr:PREDICTED: uncharacterized protein LOC100883535 [Megachile rotundata]